MSDSPIESESVVVTSGDAGTPVSLLELKSSETIRVDTVVITYSNAAGNEAQVDLYDDTHNTGSVVSSDRWFTAQLSPGDKLVVNDATLAEVKDGIPVKTQNNNDDVSVVVGGELVTS